MIDKKKTFSSENIFNNTGNEDINFYESIK